MLRATVFPDYDYDNLSCGLDCLKILAKRIERLKYLPCRCTLNHADVPQDTGPFLCFQKYEFSFTLFLGMGLFCVFFRSTCFGTRA